MEAFLQGRWLGHPLHPIIVDFPVALIPGAMLFGILSLPANNNAWVKAATIALLVAVIIAALSIILGIAEWADIPDATPRARQTATIHAGLNLVVTVFTIGALVRKAGEWDRPAVSAFSVILLVLAVAFASVSGYLGGKLVYTHQLGVGREERTGHSYARDGRQTVSTLPPESEGFEHGTAANATARPWRTPMEPASARRR